MNLSSRVRQRVASLALLAAAIAIPGAAQPPADPPEPGIYKGRQIAHVMSWRGAPWLEREDRAEEEDTAALMAKLALEPGQSVADIGCGSGYYTRRMVRAVAPSGTVFAVDVQPEMLDILRRRLREDSIENVVTVRGRDDKATLPAGEIDWILLVDVYHEFQQPEAMLASMHAALADDGRVALAEYRAEGDSAAHIRADHRMSVEQVLAEWEPAGFELVELWQELPTQHLFVFRKAGDGGR